MITTLYNRLKDGPDTTPRFSINLGLGSEEPVEKRFERTETRVYI